MLRVLVLGAAAGGGFPQWNSAGPGCRRARAGDPAARPRTQASVAVSADGERWVLLNAAPELRLQIEASPALHPRPAHGIRHSPIAAVLLTGGEVDTLAGLLSLRERHPFALYAAPPTLAVLAENPIFGVLSPALVPRRALRLDAADRLADAGGAPLGLVAEAFAVPGKVPLFRETGEADPGRDDSGETIGLRLAAAMPDGREAGDSLFFIPGCAAMTDPLRARLRGAAAVLFDGTLYDDDEMIRLGAGTKTGARMGHMALSGPAGTLAAFAGLGVRRRVLIHLNNTNPVLLADSPARAEVSAAGWEVAEDGMEFVL
ncbi:pyrroloquinoline quinone biosynthesis protein PqqB [Roseomonas sp. NAR14]|uniref:Coenzyme PQQ synthesis protein B n=1 Tax=Roseomonas acroporae TaxID=2937791 RepID=A0A9X2BVK8_9PROT|nr:pyrroloquinoline quinone biosynthesis protein PqqB [Roseomonas acroporae]MCK8786807.1 pyrroloquinoline quinone biosynthesis protein PqqB [Roseomonas acroporae]